VIHGTCQSRHRRETRVVFRLLLEAWLRFRQSMKIVEATFNTLAAAIASANGHLTKA
jgi:hypothetical protein